MPTVQKDLVKAHQTKVRKCKLCKKPYLHPCDGKNKSCMNGLWVQSGHNIKKYDQMREKLGLAAPKPQGKGRTRLVQDAPKPKAKKRVRL